jgi:steroid delta-isomerase-like uncharacterized protein
MTEDPKQIVVRLYEEGVNQNRLDVVSELVSTDLVDHNPVILDAPSGPDAIRGGIAMLHDSFPDLEVHVEDLIAEGDRVVARLRLSGTNIGAYRRGGATGKRAQWRAIDVWRVQDGRILEHWGIADRFEMLQQLGLIPSDEEIAKASGGSGEEV